MKRSILKPRLVPGPFFFILAVAGFLLAGCGDDSPPTGVPGPDPAEAPELPPASTMSVDLSTFPGLNQYQGMGEVAAYDEGIAGQNWINAVSRVSVLSGISAALLTPPATALALALSAEPEQTGPTTWVWTFSSTFQGEQWQLRLTGRITMGGYAYELRASSEVDSLPLDDALWFDGEAGFDLTEGVWRIYDPLDAGERQVLDVGWTIESSAVTLELTVRDPQSSYQGTGLTWTAAGTDLFMAYDLVEQAALAAVGTIGWESATGAGSIQATDYRDNVKSCWDELRQDVACEE